VAYITLQGFTKGGAVKCMHQLADYYTVHHKLYPCRVCTTYK